MIKTLLQKRNNELVKRIHFDFDTAEDRLLQEANKILEIKPDENLLDRASRLEKIGFTNTPISKEAQKIKESKQSLVKTKEQAELIQYYKFNYPFLKFLTEDELNRICDKYSLIYAPVSNYIKEVPEKNLREIENAQKLKPIDIIKDQFKLYENTHGGDEKLFLRLIGKIEPVFTADEIDELLRKYTTYSKDPFGSLRSGIYSSTAIYAISEGVPDMIGTISWSKCEKISKSGLFIAAPKSHFSLEGLSNKSKHGFFNVQIFETKDPIVFRYARGGIQVLSKWGLEGGR